MQVGLDSLQFILPYQGEYFAFFEYKIYIEENERLN